MIKKRHIFALGLPVLMLAAPVAAQDTIIYLTFDEAADATNFADGDAYTLGSSERLRGPSDTTINITPEFKFRDSGPLGGSNGPDIGPVPTLTDGTNLQGGKALLLNNGNSNGGDIEGLRLVADAEVPSRDFTMEVVWWTDNAVPTDNLIGLQYPIGSETATGQEEPAFFIRSYDNSGTLTTQWWNDNADGDNTQGVQVTGASAIEASIAYHDVLVFDYNDGDPATSTVTAYRNGSSVGSATYDASGTDNILFGLRGDYDGDTNPDRLFAIGYNAADDPPSGGQERGVVGGVDAVAITVDALLDGTSGNEFVLPGGTPYTAAASVSGWNLYSD